MKAHAVKTQTSKSHVIAKNDSDKKYRDASHLHFTDNRPEAESQRNLGEMANNNLQHSVGTQLKSIIDTRTESPMQMKALEKFEPVQQVAGGKVAQRDPIEDVVLDKDEESVKNDMNAAMKKIRTKLIDYTEKSQAASKALEKSGRDWMVYAPLASWRYGMLGLLKNWDESWSIEDSAGLL
ncbi:MAG TPA: hypothetical protein VKA27_17905, partial [Sunxiuqinia sp.]|nr:hypothetical protein [Sunxiuqinia sp.]